MSSREGLVDGVVPPLATDLANKDGPLNRTGSAGGSSP